jgi:acetate kinase
MTGKSQAILVLNAGSSSIKFSLFVVSAGRLERDLWGQISGLTTAPHFIARRNGDIVSERQFAQGPMSHVAGLEVLLECLLANLGERLLAGIGHRVVHGGLEFMAPVLVDEAVLAKLERYVPLAPLHQPHNLAAIRAMLAELPGIPEVACFDTAFHRTVPEVARVYALPPRFAEAGVRRYGFHGLSYEYVASVLPQLDPRAASGRTVVFHLGNGSSMCALAGGRSVATTMGFTAVDGLPMGTRCGTLDPGVVLFMFDEMKLSVREVERLIYHESGMLGMSGVSSDMRELVASDAPAARLAVDVYVYRALRELGSLAAALGGLDALVFTGGIGENRHEIRGRICRGAAWLGLELDEDANLRHERRISAAASRVAAYVLPTAEELMIARHVAAEVGLDAQ